MSSSRSARSRNLTRPSQIQLKKFTFKQIQEKVAERWEIPEYYDILMEAAVKEEADGIQFNLKHPSFQKLIKLVKEHDINKKKNNKSSSSFATKKVKKKDKKRKGDNENSNNNKELRVKNKSRKSNKKVKSQQEWLDILTEQLSSHSPNAKIVREACKHVGIPINLRATIWKILLNVPKKKAKLFQRQNKDYYNSPHRGFKTKPVNKDKDKDNNNNKSSLNSPNNNASFEPLRDDPPPLYNQRVIQADIERTRPTMKCFQDSAIRHEMEIILTEYCHRKKVSYKQGMNYVLAPFFMIEMKDRLDIYLCFESFIETYLNSTFNDEEFGSLQCIFRMFRLLIQYHDPSLSTFLDHHEIMPELFASGWFMTIHANKCDQNTLLHLWDEILLENDTCFHYFIDVEILRQNRSDIMKKSQEELPQFLVNLIIEDRDYARRLLKEARKSSINTPVSFHEMLENCSNNQIQVDSVDYIRLEKLPCLSIEPKELIGHCYAEQLLNISHNNKFDDMFNNISPNDNNRDIVNGGNTLSNLAQSHITNGNDYDEITPNGSNKKFKFAMKRKNKDKNNGDSNNNNNTTSQPPPPIPSNNNDNDEDSTNKRYSRKVRKLLKQSTKYAEQKHLKFFILDCRSLEEYEAGHLPCAFWINPKLEVSSEELREKLNSLLSMKGCHFVLFFDGRHNSSDQLLLNNNDPLSLQQQQQDLFNMNQHYNDFNQQSEEYQDEQQIFRQSLLYFFLEKRVKYISICESGYAGCHELIVGNLELIDHNYEKCIECNGKWKNSLLSSVKGRFSNLMSVAGGSMEKLRNKYKMIESRHTKQQQQSHTNTSPSNDYNTTKDNGKLNKNDTRNKNKNNDKDNYYLNDNEPSFILTNNYDTKSIDTDYLDNIHLCKNEPLLMIYLSILRNRDTKDTEKFQDVTHKLLVLVFNQIFSYHFRTNVHWEQTECYSPLDITYGSIMSKRGIYGVCLNDSCESVLTNLLISFQPIIRSVIGTLKVEESFSEDKDGIIRSNRQAVALMPKDIDKRIVIIFHDIINQQNCNNELQSAIDALLKLGAKCENIIIISLIASRQSLITLIQRFKKLHIWSACIDAVNSHSTTKLIPGIGVFQHRYQDNKSKMKSPRKKKIKKNKDKSKDKNKDKEKEEQTTKGGGEEDVVVENKENESETATTPEINGKDESDNVDNNDNDENDKNDIITNDTDNTDNNNNDNDNNTTTSDIITTSDNNDNQ